MTGAVIMLWYLCTPVPESTRLTCHAREAHAATCAQAIAIVESGMVPGRLWFPAACIDNAIPTRRAGR